jgi:DNA-binding protein HU-beta
MAKARRTTHRSSAGKKLYAVRDASGRFKDIQTYERAHRADLARKSKAEVAAAKKKAKKKAAKKTTKKKTVKKAAKKR